MGKGSADHLPPTESSRFFYTGIGLRRISRSEVSIYLPCCFVVTMLLSKELSKLAAILLFNKELYFSLKIEKGQGLICVAACC